MISIKTFVFNALMENTYVLFDETKECVIIDPGCYEEAEKEELTDFISTNGLKVVKLLNTHCHIDHVLGNSFVKRHYKVPLFIHHMDEATLKAVEVYAPAYGFRGFEPTTADQFIEVPGSIGFGTSALEVRFTPGHAPGHVVFCNQAQKVCIGGDVLFRGSVGRTDLPGGNFDTLIKSIFEQLYTLDDSTVVYPGHGPETTIAYEKASNPFCKIK